MKPFGGLLNGDLNDEGQLTDDILNDNDINILDNDLLLGDGDELLNDNDNILGNLDVQPLMDSRQNNIKSHRRRRYSPNHNENNQFNIRNFQERNQYHRNNNRNSNAIDSLNPSTLIRNKKNTHRRNSSSNSFRNYNSNSKNTSNSKTINNNNNNYNNYTPIIIPNKRNTNNNNYNNYNNNRIFIPRQLPKYPTITRKRTHRKITPYFKKKNSNKKKQRHNNNNNEIRDRIALFSRYQNTGFPNINNNTNNNKNISNILPTQKTNINKNNNSNSKKPLLSHNKNKNNNKEVDIINLIGSNNTTIIPSSKPTYKQPYKPLSKPTHKASSNNSNVSSSIDLNDSNSNNSNSKISNVESLTHEDLNEFKQQFTNNIDTKFKQHTEVVTHQLANQFNTFGDVIKSSMQDMFNDMKDNLKNNSKLSKKDKIKYEENNIITNDNTIDRYKKDQYLWKTSRYVACAINSPKLQCEVNNDGTKYFMFPITITNIKKTEKAFISLFENENNIFKIISRNEFNTLNYGSVINKNDANYIAVLLDSKHEYFFHRLENDIHCDTFKMDNDQILKTYMGNNFLMHSIYYDRKQGRGKSIRLVRGFCTELNQRDLIYHGFILNK